MGPQDKIQEELRKKRADYDRLRGQTSTLKSKTEYTKTRVAQRQRELEQAETEAARAETEYTKNQEGMADYQTQIDTLARQMKDEAEKLKRAA